MVGVAGPVSTAFAALRYKNLWIIRARVPEAEIHIPSKLLGMHEDRNAPTNRNNPVKN